MKKLILILAVVASGLANANADNSCKTNSWIVTLNANGKATATDVISALDLMYSYGISNAPGSASPGTFVMNIAADPKVTSSSQLLSSVLANLFKIQGTEIQCNLDGGPVGAASGGN